MMLKKLAFAACVLLPMGIAATGGGVVLVRAYGAQDPKPASVATPGPATKPATGVDAAKPEEIDPLLRELIEAARKRLEAQRPFYEEGRITIDRFADASVALEQVDLFAAKTEAERRAIRRRHVDRLKAIENREKSELEVGRGTVADLAEAHQRRLEAEAELNVSEKQAAENAAILRRLDELERKVEQLQWERERGAPKTNQRNLDPIRDPTLLENIDQLRRIEKSRAAKETPRP